MDSLTTDSIKEQIKAKKADMEKFAKEAQDELNARNQKIQADTNELQELVKKFQSQVDKRAGAIESLEALIALPKPEPKLKMVKK